MAPSETMLWMDGLGGGHQDLRRGVRENELLGQLWEGKVNGAVALLRGLGVGEEPCCV